MPTVAQILTDQILKQLDQGVAPWIKPWHTERAKNAQSNRCYSGINAILLSDGKYLTFNQLSKLGARIKQGAHGHMIAFTKPIKVKDKQTDQDKMINMLRYYKVFNVNDISGLPDRYYAQRVIDFIPEQRAESIIARSCAVFVSTEQRAYFRPSENLINMPKPETFASVADYYKVAFHELIHWTKQNGCIRDLDYSTEELVAEIGANLLVQECGLTSNIEQSAAYCASWATKIRDKQVAIFQACKLASVAVDFLLGTQSEPTVTEE